MSKTYNQDKLETIPLDVWIYDFEVYKHFWCVSFYNLKSKELKTYKTGQNYQLINFINKDLKGQFVGGYNSSNFDDYILKEVMAGVNPYKLSEWIINGNKPWEWEYTKHNKLPFFSFDIMKLLGPGRLSLKKYEAYLGLKIVETNIPFDYPQKLSDEQEKLIIEYNIYDTKATSFLFLKFIDPFIIKLKLISDYNLDNSALNKTSTQLTALVFEANPSKLPKYKTYYYKCPENIKQMYQKALPEYLWIIEKLETTQFVTEMSENYIKEQIDLTIKVNDLIYEFKSGGLHAAKQKIIDKPSNIYNSDIVSNYPSLIRYYNYSSRAAKNMSGKIGELIKKRIEAKNNNDDLVSSYLKELIVRPFGAMGYKYSALWDGKQRMSICLTGQLIIFFLSVKISKYAEVLQVNTDGVMYLVNDLNNIDKIKKLMKAWEQITFMQLETERYSRLFQKDVNNYILVNEKDKIKTKGSMVKYYNEQFHNLSFNTVRGVVNNSLSVLDKAVVDYFVNNIDPEITIKNEQDLVKFQFVFDIKGNYSHIFYGDKLLENMKVCRIFYTKAGSPVFKAQALPNGNYKKDKVPLSSEKCTVYNDIIINKPISLLDLDYEYYTQLAYARIEQYKNEYVKNKFKLSYPGESYECGLCSASLMNELVVRTLFDNIEVCKQCYFGKVNNE